MGRKSWMNNFSFLQHETTKLGQQSFNLLFKYYSAVATLEWGFRTIYYIIVNSKFPCLAEN